MFNIFYCIFYRKLLVFPVSSLLSKTLSSFPLNAHLTVLTSWLDGPALKWWRNWQRMSKAVLNSAKRNWERMAWNWKLSNWRRPVFWTRFLFNQSSLSSYVYIYIYIERTTTLHSCYILFRIIFPVQFPSTLLTPLVMSPFLFTYDSTSDPLVASVKKLRTPIFHLSSTPSDITLICSSLSPHSPALF